MKRLAALLSIILSMGSLHAYAKSQGEPLDSIVAIVNDDVITKSELSEAIERNKMQIAQSGIPAPADNVLRKETLDQLINRKVEMQIAKQAGVHINDAELDKAIKQIASQNQLSVNDMYQRLISDGLSIKSYREEIRNQLILQKVRQHEVGALPKITEKEVNEFLRSKVWQQAQANGPKEYHLQDIVVPLSDKPTEKEIAAAKTRAQTVVEKWNKGEKMDNAADVQGTDLGWRKLAEIPDAFVEKIGSMEAKQIAGPIQTGNGFHVIRLVEVRSVEGDQTQAPKPDRKQVEALLMQRKYEQSMQTWISKMRGQSYIETDPAKLNS
jgi:peptidyl-prolyl cis-trans isomerase SurA